MVRRVPLLAALLLLPMAAAPLTAGSQHAGGAGHPGSFVPSTEALDVLGRVDVWPDGTVGDLRFSSAFLPVGDVLRGAVGAPSTGGGCTLVDILADGTMERVIEVPACADSAGLPVLEATAPAWNLLCRKQVPASSALLLVVDDEGNEVWSISATEAFGPTATGGAWSCLHAVLDGDLVVATLVDGTPSAALAEAAGRNGILGARAADGDIAWLTEVSLGEVAADLGGTQINGPSGGPHPTFTPLTVTATSSGYVIMGDVSGARAAVLLDREGAYGEMLYSTETPAGRPYTRLRGTLVDETLDETLRPSVGSGWGVASGPLAYLALGADVLALEPTAPRPVALRTPELAFSFQPHAGLGPVLVGEHLVIPMQSGVLAVGRDDLATQWQHRMNAGTGFWMWDLAATASGDLWLAGIVPGIELASLQRLSADNGHLLQQLPLNLTLVETQVTFANSLLRIVPTPDGFLVLNKEGDGVRVGKADAALAPVLLANGLFPAPGQEFSLKVDPVPGTKTTIYWGNGVQAPVETGSVSATRFEAAGDTTVRATSVYPDGRTATSTLVVHVGGTPPPELNFLQRAFSDQNRDTTWGVIGLVLAAFSGAGAVAAATWRRRGLAADLRRLDAIRALGATDALAAAAELRDYRRDLRKRAAKGAVQGGEFASLSHEAVALSQSLQRRVLAPFEGRIDEHLHALLDAAMADGILTAAESDRIGSAIQGELSLTPAERTDLARLLGVWA